MGGPEGARKRNEWARAVPLVQSGGPRRPVHVLLRMVCQRVAPSHRPRLHPRTIVRAGPGYLRHVRRRYRRMLDRIEAIARSAAPKAAGAMGPKTPDAENVVGRGSRSSGLRRRRRVRSGELAHLVPDLPPPRDGSAAPAAIGIVRGQSGSTRWWHRLQPVTAAPHQTECILVSRQ
jgi:hypothetical protein